MTNKHRILAIMCVAALAACENDTDMDTPPDFTRIAGREGMPAVAMKNTCDACHTIKEHKVGPSWMEVSQRFKGNAEAKDYLAHKIKKGGTGAWGDMPMPPNPSISEADTNELVDFILGLAK